DAVGAGRLLGGVRRVAHEDPSSAGRILCWPGVERTADRDRADVGLVQQEVALAMRPGERLADRLSERVGFLDEGRRYNAWARLDRSAGYERFGRRVDVGRGGLPRLALRAEHEDLHAFAIDAHFELMRL